MWMSINQTTATEATVNALLVYEYLLTLSQEVDCIWHRKTSITTILFLINRYSIVFVRAFNIVQLVSWGAVPGHDADMACTVLSRLVEVSSIILYVSVALFSALRLYAITNKNLALPICVLSLGLVFPIVNTYYFTTLRFHAVAYPLRGCVQRTSLELGRMDTVESLTIFNTIISMLFEGIVIIATWARTIGVLRMLRKGNSEHGRGVTYLMLRDGSVYFVTLLFFNVLSLLSIRIPAFNDVPTFIDTLTSILISRFILNLRDDNAFDPSASSSLGYTSDGTVHFVRVVAGGDGGTRGSGGGGGERKSRWGNIGGSVCVEGDR